MGTKRRRCSTSSITCPCCREPVQGDVWYDCACFQGGKKACATCQLPEAEQTVTIAATMRELGWDKHPSPGMRDYLTPGWRPPCQAAVFEVPPSAVFSSEEDVHDPDCETLTGAADPVCACSHIIPF